jgi:anti-anti-sigma factor
MTLYSPGKSPDFAIKDSLSRPQTSQEGSGTLVLPLEGSLTIANSEKAECFLKTSVSKARLFDTPCQRVVLDCSELNVIDSSGLKTILQLYQFLQPKQIMLQLRVKNGSAVAKTLQLSQLEKLISIQEVQKP